MPAAKAPTTPPAAGGKPILEGPDAWTPEAPSAIPYDTGWAVPHAMTKDDIKRCIGEFAAAAKRVDRIGYDVIELHGAHGYLGHQFLSPISNKRTDEYGGSLENRMRFVIEMYEAVRTVWPAPEETTPPGLVRLVRSGLGLDGVPVAGGTDMYFCEVNRTRPQIEAMDGLFWSLNPQVHAFDDVSLVETPEAQGEQVKTALVITGGKPAFVGPVTLKRRYNVNASEAEAEEAADELPDSVDPRQASLLGAAWTAASVKYLAEAGAAAVTYFETTGWRGVVQGDEAPTLPERFPAQAGQAFPLYHVLADAAGWRGAELLACTSSRPLDVVGLAVRESGSTHVLVANLTPHDCAATVSGLAGPVTVRRLNAETAPAALGEPERFRAGGERIEAGDGFRLDLAPYETLRIDC